MVELLEGVRTGRDCPRSAPLAAADPSMGAAGPQGRERAPREAIDGENCVIRCAITASPPQPLLRGDAQRIRRLRFLRATSVAARLSGEGCLYCPFDLTARLMVACDTPNSRASSRCDFTVCRWARHSMKRACSARMVSTWASVSALGRPIVLLPVAAAR